MSQSSEKSAHTARRPISNENLHISSFVLVRRESDGAILFLRAGENHPLTFRRGKLLLPASILEYGENPKDAAMRILQRQLEHSESLEPKFLDFQSYIGAHWDICFIFEAKLKGDQLHAREPFVEASFHQPTSLPRETIAGDHLDIIDAIKLA